MYWFLWAPFVKKPQQSGCLLKELLFSGEKCFYLRTGKASAAVGGKSGLPSSQRATCWPSAVSTAPGAASLAPGSGLGEMASPAQWTDSSPPQCIPGGCPRWSSSLWLSGAHRPCPEASCQPPPSSQSHQPCRPPQGLCTSFPRLRVPLSSIFPGCFLPMAPESAHISFSQKGLSGLLPLKQSPNQGILHHTSLLCFTHGLFHGT